MHQITETIYLFVLCPQLNKMVLYTTKSFASCCNFDLSACLRWQNRGINTFTGLCGHNNLICFVWIVLCSIYPSKSSSFGFIPFRLVAEVHEGRDESQWRWTRKRWEAPLESYEITQTWTDSCIHSTVLSTELRRWFALHFNAMKVRICVRVSQ